MHSLDGAIFELGKLSALLEKSPMRQAWIRRRRLVACADLYAADFDAAEDIEGILMLVFGYRSGPLAMPELATKRAAAAAAFILLQEDMAHASQRHERRRGQEGYIASGGSELRSWLNVARAAEDTWADEMRASGAMNAATAIWRFAQEDTPRSAVLVGVSTGLRKSFSLGPDAPGIWGALPRASEGRQRFHTRFWTSLRRQASEGISEISDVERWRASSLDLMQDLRSTSRLPLALDMLLETRVLSPAALSAGIGVSLRGAGQMLDELERRGCAREMSARRTYRRFIHRDDHVIARILAATRPQIEVQPPQAVAPAAIVDRPRALEPLLPGELAAFAEGALEEAFSSVDAASANVEAALARIKARGSASS
jgi:hypothetical protein